MKRIDFTFLVAVLISAAAAFSGHSAGVCDAAAVRAACGGDDAAQSVRVCLNGDSVTLPVAVVFSSRRDGASSSQYRGGVVSRTRELAEFLEEEELQESSRRRLQSRSAVGGPGLLLFCAFVSSGPPPRHLCRRSMLPASVSPVFSVLRL
jgi:hypothetical protein